MTAGVSRRIVQNEVGVLVGKVDCTTLKGSLAFLWFQRV